MRLIRIALRRPVTVMVAALAVALTAAFAATRMRADIFPDLDLPVIYVAQPYGGMSPAQMEGYITYYYEYHFLYINGIESVESKSIQNTSLLKLTFHPGTNMAEALAQTVGYVNRARAFMPPGTVGPFIMRFDAGTVPVGYLVFRSDTRTLGEIQDLALNRVRPQFATLPGLTSPPPFGGSQRTIVIRVDPDRLRSYGMAPDEVIRAVSSGNVIMPSGSVNVGDETRISPINSVVGNITDLLDLPIRTGTGPPVSIRDIGTVSDSTDIPTAYALVDGRRAVYIPVTKRPDASTLAVVREVTANLARFQSLVPDDIRVSYELDQSSHVSEALASVLREAGLGALLTGLVVLVFLRDWRSAAIVVVTIPFALVSAVAALWGAGQTINIMTLGGLALAVGILVDEATVAIENIHSHLGRGPSVARAVLDASGEVVVPRLLAMLTVVAVFVPSFFMTGISRSLFVPLSLAVGFAMIASFLLSSSLVPVLSVWWLGRSAQLARDAPADGGWAGRLRDRLAAAHLRVAPARGVVVAAYFIVTVGIVAALAPTLGREIFPPSDIKAFQLRFRAPAGTKFESTERLARGVLDAIRTTAGPDQVEVTLGYVGVQPSSYPINTIFLWTGGPHEGVLQVALRQDASVALDALKERLRAVFHQRFPDAQFSFEPGDIVSRIMNVGAPTPVEVAVMGPDFAASRAFADKVRGELGRIDALRDLQYGQTLDYPAIQVDVDRQMAGQLGVTVDQVGRSFAAATSSSRFVAPNYWEDPRSGIAFQVQVQVPQPRMTTLEDLRVVPVTAGGSARALLGDLARIQNATIVGEYDRINGQRMVTLTANVSGEDLGRAASQVTAAIRRAGDPPRATTVAVRGQVAAMEATFVNITAGLIVAIVVIFLLLAANFQSLRLAVIVVSTVPAVLAGVVVMLRLTGTTVNVQSFMGAIMATGVAVANAILLVTFAEQARRQGTSPLNAAVDAARARMRPVLMTSSAMIAGMMPMALALGAGAEATAPLGRAVIGGLASATLATLVILPSVYSLVQRSAGTKSPSLDPDDPASAVGLIVLLLAACTAASCGKATDVSGPAAAPPEPATIDVVRVVEQPLDVQLSLPGELTPFQSVAIVPKVTGFVRAVHVDRGSSVRAGDRLVTLDAPELVAQRSEAASKLRAAEAQLSVAEAKAQAEGQTLGRLKAAAAVPGVVAGNDVVIAEKAADASRNQVTAAQQSVEAAREAWNAVRDMEGYLRVTAPFAGIVTERNVHPGALVGPSSGGAAPPMLRLVENNRLRLVVAVPEAYSGEVAIGALIPFSVAAYPAQTFTGKTARVARAVDVGTRTMAVELDVANGNGQLAPGEFCQVRWPIRRSGPSLFVPGASVAATTGRTFVIRIRGGKTEWVDVRVGLSSGALVEVFGDLHPGDEVAGRGTDELQPGIEVHTRESKPKA